MKRSTILAAIHKVITEFDRSGEINVQLADGRSPKVVGLRRVKGHIMEVRLLKTAVRRMNCERNIRFIAKFVRVGLWLAMMVGRQEPSLCRAIQYSLRNDEFAFSPVTFGFSSHPLFEWLPPSSSPTSGRTQPMLLS